jgi:hypothetical protein
MADPGGKTEVTIQPKVEVRHAEFTQAATPDIPVATQTDIVIISRLAYDHYHEAISRAADAQGNCVALHRAADFILYVTRRVVNSKNVPEGIEIGVTAQLLVKDIFLRCGLAWTPALQTEVTIMVAEFRDQIRFLSKPAHWKARGMKDK